MNKNKNALIKIMEKEFYKKSKCQRCKCSIKENRDFYQNENNNIICSDCLTDSDYTTENTGYYGLKEGDETFQFLYYEWNIGEMIKYCEENSVPVVNLNIDSKIKDWNMSGFITIKEELLDKVDMNKPGIIINLSEEPKREILIADGNHRLRKAILNGDEEFQCYYLNFREQFKFLINNDFTIFKSLLRHIEN